VEQLAILMGAYFFIFAARVIDVSLDVLRILMLMRDRRILASVIGFFEVTVFVLALNEVLKGGLDDTAKILAYAGGFATGNYVGSIIENRLAMGYLSLQVFPPSELVQKFVTVLRQEGFGVTTVSGQGRDGERMILFVTLKRKNLNRAIGILNEMCPNVFFTISDARHIKGGVFPAPKGR